VGTAKFAQLKSIFSRALELKEGEVSAYLDEACAGSPELRLKLDEMLLQAVTNDMALIGLVSSPLEHTLDLGIVLAQRFRLDSFIGRGGMGEVYLAQDLELDGQVALKTVRSGLLDTQGTSRFRREVQLSRQVTHANICRVFDVGKEVLDGRELIFLTMEYLEGQTLAQYLSSNGKLGIETAEPLIRQLADGLEALHAKGIMHRDLKPANVMLVGQRLCIMDFGLARVFDGEGSDVNYTQTGAIIGTPGYMAPEQLKGETATAASDIYSFGLLIFEMLTGTKASSSDDLADGKTGLPGRWESVVMRCVEQRQSARPKSATEALALLEAADAPKVSSWKPWQIAVGGLVLAGLAAVPFVMPERSLPSLSSQTAPAASANDEILRARQLMTRYYKPQNVQSAMEILQKVVEQNPKLALGYAELGAALFRVSTAKNDPALLEKAKQACNRAIELDPEMAEAHKTLGLIYLDNGRRDLARSEMKKALDLDSKSPDVHFALAQLYRAEGRLKEKEEAIQQAIDLAPDSWTYHNWRNAEYRDQGNYEGARKELEIAARLSPDNPLIYNNLGIVLARMRNFDAAERAYLKSNELEPRARTLGNLATIHYLRGRYDKAAEVLKQAVLLEPKSYILHANLAAALDRIPASRAEALEVYRKAIVLAEPVLKSTPNDPRLLGNLASYEALLGNREKALGLIRRAIALRPDSPDVANRAVAVYEFLKERNEAMKWAAKAIQNGYSFETLKNDPELAGLRTDPRFKKLEELEKEKK